MVDQKEFDELMEKMFKRMDVNIGGDLAVTLMLAFQLASIFMVGMVKTPMEVTKVEGKTVGVIGIGPDQVLAMFHEMIPVFMKLATVVDRQVAAFAKTEGQSSEKTMDDIKDSIDKADDGKKRAGN